MEKWVNVTERDGEFSVHYYHYHRGDIKLTDVRIVKGKSREVLYRHIQEAMALLDLYEKINGVGRKDAYESKGITTQVYFIKRK